MDKKLTTEQIKKATKIARKGLVLPSGSDINAWRNMANVQFKPLDPGKEVVRKLLKGGKNV